MLMKEGINNLKIFRNGMMLQIWRRKLLGVEMKAYCVVLRRIN